MNVQTIQDQLRGLRLLTAAQELEEVLAGHKKAANLTWVSELLMREMDARKERALESRIKRANFPEIKTLEAFDWKFNPEVDEEKVRELATLNFIEENQIGLFLGAPGTGKTHLAIALGLLAAKHGYTVYCSSLKILAKQITLAKEKNDLDGLFKKILSSKLWIIDDWGVVSMSRDVAEEVFDLFDRRKYGSAMILTSNRDIEEWNQVFPEPVLANAAIDRMFERAEILIFKGRSYRLSGRIEMKERRHVDTSPENV